MANYEALKKIIEGLDQRDQEEVQGIKHDDMELDEKEMAKVIADRNKNVKNY